MRSPEPENESLRALMAEVAGGLARLVRGELMLARAEATEGLQKAAGGVVKIAVAAVLALVGLNVLAGAAVAALAATGLGPAWASLIVGVVLCVLALVLVLAGRATLTLRGLWPDRALRGVRRDVEAVQAGLSETGGGHV